MRKNKRLAALKKAMKTTREEIASLLRDAMKRDDKIMASMFNCRAKVIHQDGSIFLVENAVVYEKGQYLVVLNEHGTPMVFHKGDLSDWRVDKHQQVENAIINKSTDSN